MGIFTSWDEVHLTRPQAVVIGVFDGVHRGHQHLLARAAEVAQNYGAQVTVITFWPPPPVVLRPTQPVHVLTLLEEKLTLLANIPAVDHVVLLPFTAGLAQMTATAFMEEVRAHIPIAALIEGDDFKLGHNREGTLDWLMHYGAAHNIAIIAIDRHEVSPTIAISSTHIRSVLAEGDIRQASKLLGRPYQITGTIVHGDARGRALGYPTANFMLDPLKFIPANGIYAVSIWRTLSPTVRWWGAASIGMRPVFQGKDRRVEVYILDIDEDLYGQTLSFSLIERLREERTFPDIAALIAQMGQDVILVRQICAQEEQARPEIERQETRATL